MLLTIREEASCKGPCVANLFSLVKKYDSPVCSSVRVVSQVLGLSMLSVSSTNSEVSDPDFFCQQQAKRAKQTAVCDGFLRRSVYSHLHLKGANRFSFLNVK